MITAKTAQAHRDAGETETEARDRVAPIAGKLRGDVLAAVVKAGPMGLTALEATIMLDRDARRLYSYAPRFAELVRDGYLMVGGRRGRRQFYVATDAGLAWAAEVAA